jgi:hypothetical protein
MKKIILSFLGVYLFTINCFGQGPTAPFYNASLSNSGNIITISIMNTGAVEMARLSGFIVTFNVPSTGSLAVNSSINSLSLVDGNTFSSESTSSSLTWGSNTVASFTYSGPSGNISISSLYVEVASVNRTGSFGNSVTILPITLQSFTAKKVTESSSLLEWTTASEEDAESIDIERSFDAKTWTKLATQQAVGGLNLSTDYSYLDKDVVLQRSEGATAYYRLYLRDKDGSGKYSDVRSVAFDPITGINFVAYPNPANTNLQLKLQMVSDQPSTQVNILDISGKLVQKANVSTNGITNIDVSNFAKGLYHLQMIHNDQVVVRKVVVN